jgi:hypothetical protein
MIRYLLPLFALFAVPALAQPMPPSDPAPVEEAGGLTGSVSDEKPWQDLGIHQCRRAYPGQFGNHQRARL